MSYLPIDRKIFEHSFWDERRVFSRFEAWLDLIQLASYTADNSKIINGVIVRWGRGEYPVSRSFLCKRWGWSEQKVRTYWALLKSEGQIELKTTSVATILKLCNYDLYNRRQPADNPSNNQRTTSGQPEVYKDNKDKELNNRIKPSKSADFIDQIIDQFVQAHGSYEILNRGKERAAAGKLLKIHKEKYPAADNEETLQSLRAYFDACVNITEPWLHDNMSLSIIISKFNEINNYLKNGKHKGTGATDAELRELFAKKYGVSDTARQY